jgi:integrase/recombinase XerD
MPAKLPTTISKISLAPNSTNASIIAEFYQYMKSNESSEHHQNNNLKVVLSLAKFLGPRTTFYDIQSKEQIVTFLDTKIRSSVEDPEKKWITTWNHYLHRIKLFFRWLYNQQGKKLDGFLSQTDWKTPGFVQIRGKKTKRESPYSQSEIWERDEILFIVKYEPYIRNKAALTLFWDLDARNHEVILLKIKHIRLRERYGEGEIPQEAKTGSGPLLLTCSFPYVRDWINKHPFRNSPDARLICNLNTGAPLMPEAMWTMMKQLQNRIYRMLENGSIVDEKERQRLEFLLKTKKWNPYCIRHSAITSDSDFLPEYALKKKVRWSMNSKQGARYIKRRMGDDLKNQILVRNGIITNESATLQRKPSILTCPRCSLVNAIAIKFCSKCSYPLTPQAYEEIKANEDSRINDLEEQVKSMQQSQKQILDYLKDPMQLTQDKMGYCAGPNTIRFDDEAILKRLGITGKDEVLEQLMDDNGEIFGRIAKRQR